MPTSLLSRFDKCFAAAWLDHDRVLLGTKDNKLASLNIDTGECNEVPLPSRLRFERMELTEASERADGDWISEPSTSRNASPSYAIGQDPGFAPFGRGEVRNVAFPPTPDLVDGASIYENCGIHAIAINPSGTRMVTGGANPSDAAVFSVPDLRPTALLTSHTDWVFGLIDHRQPGCIRFEGQDSEDFLCAGCGVQGKHLSPAKCPRRHPRRSPRSRARREVLSRNKKVGEHEHGWMRHIHRSRDDVCSGADKNLLQTRACVPCHGWQYTRGGVAGARQLSGQSSSRCRS